MNTTLFDNFFYTDLQKIYALSYEPIATVINQMEINIIETLRRYINRTIININNELRELNPELGLFVAGGDALRRYKNDISVTKDIDCKIYLPKVLLTKDLIDGISLEDVKKKEYPFVFEKFYYVNPQYVPEDDKRWQILTQPSNK